MKLLILIALTALPGLANAKISAIGFLGASLGQSTMGNGANSAIDRKMNVYSPDLYLGLGTDSGRFYLGVLAQQETRAQMSTPSEVGFTDLSGKGLTIAPALMFQFGGSFHGMLGYRVSADHTLDKPDIFGVQSAYKGSGFFARLGVKPLSNKRFMFGLAYSSDTYTESITPNIKNTTLSFTVSFRMFGGGSASGGGGKK